MVIHIAYFTSTGNTLRLCRRAEELFGERGHETRLFDAAGVCGGFGRGCDLLGLIYPVWGSNLPDPLRDLVERMPAGGGKRMFLLGNCAVFTGDTGMHWRRILGRKGYEVRYVDHVIMPMNVNIPGFNFWPVPDSERREKILRRADEKMERVCTGILDGRWKWDGINPISMAGGWAQRTFYGIAELWKKMLQVDPERCNRCGLCVRMCPTENITLPPDGPVAFDSRCILCLKCYNLCPQDAVLVGRASRDTERFRRYRGAEGYEPILYR